MSQAGVASSAVPFVQDPYLKKILRGSPQKEGSCEKVEEAVVHQQGAKEVEPLHHQGAAFHPVDVKGRLWG